MKQRLRGYLDTSLLGFSAASLALHLSILLLWPVSTKRGAGLEPISVTLVPAARQPEGSATEITDQARATQTSRAPAIIAQKSSLPVRRESNPTRPQAAMQQRPSEEKPHTSEPPKPVREAESETSIVTARTLPTLKELLPPATWSSLNEPAGRKDGPVRLDTKDPQYITYFGSIKRDIELVWQYPELALRYGLQGKLLMIFSVRSSGELESARILRSSGSHLLDEEALRAVKTAAPFQPIPPWIDKNRIEIIASFEYLDNRLNYRFAP